MQRGAYIGSVLAGLFAVGCGAQTAYVSQNAATAGPYVSQPTTITLLVSANGSLLGAERLRWSDWGQQVAAGSGYLYRGFANSAAASMRGTVTLNKLVTCHGKRYYAAATLKPPGALLAPTSPIRLDTPC